MKVQILLDNINSWMLPYAQSLRSEVESKYGDCTLIHSADEVEEGDVLCLLSCENIFKDLEKNKFNLAVHESDLPQGKGWSPLTWKVLEGKSEIPVTLFEAVENVDSGDIYAQEFIALNGTELLTELKDSQGKMTHKLIMDFLNNYPNVKGVKQSGESSFYKRRGPKDSELNIDKTIEEQFNLLRTVDNDRYPAFFMKDGVKYNLKIEKASE